MNHVIYKYPFPISDDFVLRFPVNSKILRVAPQNNIPTMWVLHPIPNGIEEVRRFRVYGTGHEIEHLEMLEYIASFEMNRFIWHVFEESLIGTDYIENVLKETLTEDMEQ